MTSDEKLAEVSKKLKEWREALEQNEIRERKLRRIMLGIGLAALLIALLSNKAHAASWFDFEAGLGAQQAIGWHDGIWTQQQGVPHAQRLTSPAFMAGITGQVYSYGRIDARFHIDYLYLGTTSASCECVSDADYAARNYSATRTGFSGSGHTQGIVLTLDHGVTYSGWRLGVEGGVFANWQTWHETVGSEPAFQANHKTTLAVAPVIGASLSRGPVSVRFLHFAKSQSWNPYPQFTNGANILMATYRW
jgi:hypothetical protein